jgi:hypothetical protein
MIRHFSLACILFLAFAQVAVAQTSTIADFAKFGIQAQVTKKSDARLQKLEHKEDHYYLEVKLGRLSQEQYRAMLALYGNSSRVPYDSAKEYDLVDFLHPAMQATVNQVFLPKNYDTSRLIDVDLEKDVSEDAAMFFRAASKNGISSFSNCWNTTMEVLRLMSPNSDKNKMVYRLYWPGRWDTSDIFSDAKTSAVVEASSAALGDALVVKLKSEGGGEMLQHTAIVLSASLVFERTDTTENDAYRIYFRRDVEAKYKKVFTDEERLLEYRRFHSVEDLKAPALGVSELRGKDRRLFDRLAPGIPLDRLTGGCETGLGGGCDVVYNEVNQVTVVTNPKTGRGIFYAKKELLDRFIPLKGK